MARVAPTEADDRHATAVTVASALGIAVPGYLQNGLAALGPFLIAAFSLSKSGYGLLLAAFSGIGALTSPSLGALADRIGGRRLLGWSFALAIGVAAGISLAPTLPVATIAALLGGLTASAANPATNTLVASEVPLERRGLVIGIKQAGGPAGIAAAGAVLPAVASATNWRVAYATSAILPAVGLLLLMAARRSTIPPPRPTGGRPAWATAFGRRIRLITINGAAIGFGVGASLGFIAVYAVDELGMSPTAAGVQLTIVGAVGFVARLGWGAAADRIGGSMGLLAALSVLSVLGAVGLWAAARVGVWLLVVSAVVIGASAMSWNSVGMVAVVRETSVERSGTASGIVVLGFMAGFTLGPWAFGALVDATGSYAVGWATVTAVFVLSGAVLLLEMRR